MNQKCSFGCLNIFSSTQQDQGLKCVSVGSHLHLLPVLLDTTPLLLNRNLIRKTSRFTHHGLMHHKWTLGAQHRPQIRAFTLLKPWVWYVALFFHTKGHCLRPKFVWMLPHLADKNRQLCNRSHLSLTKSWFMSCSVSRKKKIFDYTTHLVFLNFL